MERKIDIELSKHFDAIVRMTTASGFDTEKTRGLTCNVGVFKREDNAKYIRGWWEIYSDDQSCYGEGSLTFDLNKKCFDYDGAFSLSQYVCDMLEEKGFDMSEVR